LDRHGRATEPIDDLNAAEFFVSEGLEVGTAVVRVEVENGVGVARCQDHLWSPRQLAELVGQLDPMPVGKPDVDQHRVRLRLPDDLERLESPGACPAS
jgi:hypothetical protein